MFRSSFASLFLVCVMAACASHGTSSVAVNSNKPELSADRRAVWQLLAGKWYGDQPTKDGGRRQWIVHKALNGTYQIDFLETTADGKVEKNTEMGQWGLSGDILFTSYRGYMDGAQFRPVNTADPYNYDAYRLIRLDGDSLEYQHVETGNRFTIRRVPDDFVFPK